MSTKQKQGRRYGSQSRAQYIKGQEEKNEDQVFESNVEEKIVKKVNENHKCGSCIHNIEKEDEDIFCDGMCGKWYHLTCAEVTQEENRIIGKTGSNINWFCRGCADKIGEIIHEDYYSWKQNLEELKATIENLKAKLDNMQDMENRIKTLENFNIKSIKDKVEEVAAEDFTGTTEKIKKMEEKIEANKKLAETKCNAGDVNGIMKDELNKENREMQSTVRKTIAEEVSKAREKNIIIYRAVEGTSNLKADNIKHDKEIVRKLIGHCKGTMEEEKTIDKIIRLGKKEAGTVRPLLVAFKELDTKKGLFRNLKELGKEGTPEDLKNLSVSHDMTEQERKENRELVDEAKKKDKADPTHKHIVRGAPWNREIVAIPRK